MFQCVAIGKIKVVGEVGSSRGNESQLESEITLERIIAGSSAWLSCSYPDLPPQSGHGKICIPNSYPKK